jgi:hypothetical protein
VVPFQDILEVAELRNIKKSGIWGERRFKWVRCGGCFKAMRIILYDSLMVDT